MGYKNTTSRFDMNIAVLSCAFAGLVNLSGVATHDAGHWDLLLIGYLIKSYNIYQCRPVNISSGGVAYEK